MTTFATEHDCLAVLRERSGAVIASNPCGVDTSLSDSGRLGNLSPRRVLIIASRFPPVASVGAIRIRKFTRYLREFGWEPTVITGALRPDSPNSHDARRAVDTDSLRDLPADLAVHRLSHAVDHWPTHLSARLGARLGAFTRFAGLPARQWQVGLKWRLDRLHDRFAFPDRGIWRLPSVLRLARRLNKTHRFDAIFSSGMPFSDHLIALAVHRSLRIPWVADFRDPWVEYIHWKQWTSRWGRRATRRAERAVIGRAARVVSVNDHMTDRFRARYPKQSPDKFITIPNGFDAADFAESNTVEDKNIFTLLYAGSLYHTRTPDKLIDGFCDFLDRTPEAVGHAILRFIGRPGPHMDALAQRRPGAIRYDGLLPHSATCEAMAKAAVNIVLLPNLPGGEKDTTAKVYECLASGRPILAAVPPNGAAADVLRAFDGVTICNPDNADAIRNAIAEWYAQWRAGEIAVNRPAAALDPHSRRRQTKLLADCLNEICPVAAREIATR